MKIYAIFNCVVFGFIYMALYANIPYLSVVAYITLLIYLLISAYYTFCLFFISVIKRSNEEYMKRRNSILYSFGEKANKNRWPREVLLTIVSISQFLFIVPAGSYGLPLLITLGLANIFAFVFKNIATQFTKNKNKELNDKC